ncbi:hypothetical protein Tco_1060768 [Tanacetum coccineum]
MEVVMVASVVMVHGDGDEGDEYVVWRMAMDWSKGWYGGNLECLEGGDRVGRRWWHLRDSGGGVRGARDNAREAVRVVGMRLFAWVGDNARVVVIVVAMRLFSHSGEDSFLTTPNGKMLIVEPARAIPFAPRNHPLLQMELASAKNPNTWQMIVRLIFLRKGDQNTSPDEANIY